MSTPHFESLIQQFADNVWQKDIDVSTEDAIRKTAVTMFDALPLSTQEAITSQAQHYISEDLIEFVPMGYGPAACLVLMAQTLDLNPDDFGINKLEFNHGLEWVDVGQLIKTNIADFRHYFVANLTLCIDQKNRLDFISLIVLDDKKDADQALIFAANSYLDGRFNIMPTSIAEVDFTKFTTMSEATGLPVFDGIDSFLSK